LEAAHLWCQAHPDKVVGMTSRTFDLLHDFHLRFLKQCKRQCDVLVVGLDSDRLVRERKGPSRPIMSEFQREVVLNAIKYVEMVFVLDRLAEYTTVCEALPVNVVFVNQLWQGREQEVAVGRSGARVVLVPDVFEADSTSTIIDRIKTAP
jgi:D-beta-D-heptose 7-phosphate kinase/D-beta-D-heptose 1-phosphate adenosyltransferase